MGDQTLVQLAGEQRDAVHPRVVSEPVAGHADLAAAGFHQLLAVEIRPFLDRGFESGGQGRWPGVEEWTMRQREALLASWQSDHSSMRYVLARMTAG